MCVCVGGGGAGVKILKRDDYNLNSGFKCLCQFGTRLRVKRVELLSRSSSKYSGCNCQNVGYEYMLASLTNPYHCGCMCQKI